MATEETLSPDTEPQDRGRKFGTLEGVFLPNILTIVGVIMYLRLGKVMGEAGLLYGVLIILLAHAVTLTTGLWLSSVATNMRVRAGGAYYIISRSLGIEWGGCVGIPLAISQTLSIALYTLGFAESLRMMAHVESFRLLAAVGDYPLWLLGSVALALMTGLSFKGSAVVIRTQYLVISVVALSLVAIFAGGRLTSAGPQMVGGFVDLSFWQAFALFFPAVTGIMSGVSLSGDLKDPRRSIPVGTMTSVLTGLGVYLAVAVLLCVSASPEELTRDNNVLLRIAWRPEPVLAGIWAATISSGLGMILAAPRTIQALANDGILPGFLARSYGKNREPLTAMIAALLIAEGAILMGKLDLVAPILSMFFLATYGMLNLIAGLECLVDNPSYRPTIKTPWWISLLGAGCSFYVMFLIHTPATLVALVVITVIYLLLKRRNVQATWGDLRRGFWLSLIRRSLLQVECLPEHPKNWRPNIMVVTSIPQGRLNLVQLADWLGSRRGLVTLHHVLVGKYSKILRRRRMAFNNLVRFIDEEGLNALPAVDVVEDRTSDLRKIITSQGFGSFQANAVMLDWQEREELRQGEFEELCAGVIIAHKTLLLLKVDRDRVFGRRQRIDVWMPEDSLHLPMMLILSYLISQDRDWKGSRIYLHIMATGENVSEKRLEVENALTESRIAVETEFHDNVESSDIQGRSEFIARRSFSSDLVIIPFPYDGSDSREMKSILDDLAPVMARMPSVLLVRGQAYVDLKE